MKGMVKKIILTLCFPALLLGCGNRSIPLDSGRWGWWDVGINNERYGMSVWMIKTGWFEGKNKQDIIGSLPERKPYTINSGIKSFCIKESEGWNIDHIFNPLAYLDIYFDDSGRVTKAIIRERKQTLDEKMEGKGKVSSDNYKIVLTWEKQSARGRKSSTGKADKE